MPTDPDLRPVWQRDFAGFAHPALSVPCPLCRRSRGEACLRAGGRKAVTLHVARRDLLQLMFLIAFGDTARLTRHRDGWRVERLPALAAPRHDA